MKIDEIIHYASKIKSGEFVGEQVIGAVICDLANYVKNQYPRERIILDLKKIIKGQKELYNYHGNYENWIEEVEQVIDKIEKLL